MSNCFKTAKACVFDGILKTREIVDSDALHPEAAPIMHYYLGVATAKILLELEMRLPEDCSKGQPDE